MDQLLFRTQTFNVLNITVFTARFKALARSKLDGANFSTHISNICRHNMRSTVLLVLLDIFTWQILQRFISKIARHKILRVPASPKRIKWTNRFFFTIVSRHLIRRKRDWFRRKAETALRRKTLDRDDSHFPQCKSHI